MVVPQCFQVVFLPETGGFHQHRAVWVIARPPPICRRQEQHRPYGVCGRYGAGGCAQAGVLLRLLLSPCIPMLWLSILLRSTCHLCRHLPSYPTTIVSALLALLLHLDQWEVLALLLAPLLPLWLLCWQVLCCHVPRWHWVWQCWLRCCAAVLRQDGPQGSTPALTSTLSVPSPIDLALATPLAL